MHTDWCRLVNAPSVKQLLSWASGLKAQCTNPEAQMKLLSFSANDFLFDWVINTGFIEIRLYKTSKTNLSRERYIHMVIHIYRRYIYTPIHRERNWFLLFTMSQVDVSVLVCWSPSKVKLILQPWNYLYLVIQM